MPFHRQESEQSQQSFVLKSQDKEITVCQPPIQEGLVGSR
ncbi:hypothetical protein Goarm_012506 [Gossypium armourianum]|uniref:Uncharacterized protein n=1 Tax=Gossypium armourianum TaxID=34283 RepID=A0A7J9J097_9ROSI|nr:hypothetical protein [Gossypium armourianum]